MNLSQRFALLTTTCLLPVTAIPAGATNVENVNMIFSADATYLWSGTYDWPDDPDQGPVTGADFFFNDGTEHTWKLNNGATVILEQTGNQSGGRIFVGSGGDGEITFTSDAGVPGRISARYNAFAAMRIGETPGNHSGTVNIEGGVTFESGWIFGEGSGTRSLNIHDGLFAVFSNNPDRRLNGIDVTIGPNGALWVEDSAADVVDVDSFEAFAAGATLQATDWPLVFTNNQPRNAIVGGTVNGTLITAAPPPVEPLVLVPKVPLLFVFAHADDESIFGGGVLPYYAQTRKLPVATLIMVTRNPNGSYPITSGPTSRIDEVRRAMDVYAGNSPGTGALHGTDYYTGNIVLAEGGLIDTGCCSVPPYDSWGDAGTGFGWGTSSGVTQLTPGFGNTEGIADGRLAAAIAVARQIRRFRPDVLVSCHDLEGDYGHSNHTATAIACIDAITMAADPAIDIDGLAPWQAKKLYLRGGPNDNRDTISYHFSHPEFPGTFTSSGGLHPLFHDFFEEPSLGSSTPRQIAQAGLQQHASQGPFVVSSVFNASGSFYGNHSEWWTLYHSEIGADAILPPFTISGDTTGTTYSGWARGDFFGNLTVFADRDFDGLADDWEIHYFGSLAAADPFADPDGDGQTNLFEFIAGLDPLAPDTPDFAISNDAEMIHFTIPAAEGPGYDGLTRHWRLLRSTDLQDWSEVVGEGIADGSPVSIPTSPGIRGFYRLQLELR